MATNLNLDDKLLVEVTRLGKHRSKKEAVETALMIYRARLAGPGIVELFGTIEFRDDWDPMRARGKPPGGLNAHLSKGGARRAKIARRRSA